jgi:hypothetical protein
MTPEDRIADHLTFLYGAERAPVLLERLHAILTQFQQRNPQLYTAGERLTEQDTILITYGDQVTERGQPPLQTLAEVPPSTPTWARGRTSNSWAATFV